MSGLQVVAISFIGQVVVFNGETIKENIWKTFWTCENKPLFANNWSTKTAILENLLAPVNQISVSELRHFSKFKRFRSLSLHWFIKRSLVKEMRIESIVARWALSWSCRTHGFIYPHENVKRKNWLGLQKRLIFCITTAFFQTWDLPLRLESKSIVTSLESKNAV